MIRGHKQGFPITAATQNRGGKLYALNTKENWYLCPWTSTVLEQTGQSCSSLCAQASSGVPHSPDPSQNENITFAIALVLFAARLVPWERGDWTWMAGRHSHRRRKNSWNHRFKCHLSFYHLEESWLLLFFYFIIFSSFFLPPKVVMWIKLHVQYVWSICNENTEG